MSRLGREVPCLFQPKQSSLCLPRFRLDVSSGEETQLLLAEKAWKISACRRCRNWSELAWLHYFSPLLSNNATPTIPLQAPSCISSRRQPSPLSPHSVLYHSSTLTPSLSHGWVRAPRYLTASVEAASTLQLASEELSRCLEPLFKHTHSHCMVTWRLPDVA